MRLFLLFLLAALPAAFAAPGNPSANTALAAVKLLPEGAAARLAMIEAYEGAPTPDRWHLLVFDSREETGLHEFVVAAGEVVASRSVSQFADGLSAEDVLGEGVKIDSDRVAKLAQQYAQANKQTMGSMNYALKRPGAGAAPLWKVTCLATSGEPIGHLIVTATRGTVVSHDGFPAEPATAVEKPEKPEKTEKPERPKSPPDSAVVKASQRPEKRPEPRRTEVAAREARPEPEVRRAEAVSAPEGQPVAAAEELARPGFLRRAAGTLQKAVTGRDSLNR